MMHVLLSVLLFSSSFGFAAGPTAEKLDFAKPEAQAYASALAVTRVESMNNKETQLTLTVRTLVEEGSLNSNKVLITANSQDGDEVVYLLKTELASVSLTSVKWENAKGSSAGLYMEMKGLLGGDVRKTLSVKLTDSTGVLLDKPLIYIH